MTSTPPDFAGFLQKEGGKVIRQNQTRYFELRGVTLYYYKGKPVPGVVDPPQGSIDLTNVKCVDNPKEKFSWIVTGPNLPKHYTLFASSDQEKATWMRVIENPNRSSAASGAKLPMEKKRSGGGEENSDDDDNEEAKMVFTVSPQGKKVGPQDFDVISVVGKGSFGKVYEVRKRDTGEIFAMKEMNKEVIERENLLEHTFAEKSILQKLKHPFIVQLHYAFQTRDRLYLVLDFLSGGELFFHLSKSPLGGRFDEWRAKFYCAEIGLALGHLHELNIIYRDLKPENAVLDRDGHVCLTDFGLAKTNVTQANAQTFCGTPEYLAPEFLIGGGHGKAVDWWSLGVLLYEMLYGLPPFYSENVNEMYELILKKPLEFAEDVDVTPAAKDLLRQLLDRNPAKRLQSVVTFKAHPFFADINWEDLYAKKIKPPFVPDRDSKKNFDVEFTSQKAKLSMHESQQGHTNIAGFTYQGEKSALQQ